MQEANQKMRVELRENASMEKIKEIIQSTFPLTFKTKNLAKEAFSSILVEQKIIIELVSKIT